MRDYIWFVCGWPGGQWGERNQTSVLARDANAAVSMATSGAFATSAALIAWATTNSTVVLIACPESAIYLSNV